MGAQGWCGSIYEAHTPGQCSQAVGCAGSFRKAAALSNRSSHLETHQDHPGVLTAQPGPPQTGPVRLSGGGNRSLGGPVCTWPQGSLLGRQERELAQHHCGSVCSGPFLGIPCDAAFGVCSSHRAADRASGSSQDVGKGPLCTAVPAGTSSCHRSHMASSVYEICSLDLLVRSRALNTVLCAGK